MLIKFTVYGDPVAQPRQRHAAVRGKGGRVGVRNYTPKDHPVQDFKQAVQLEATRSYIGSPIVGVVGITITFVVARPKSMRRKNTPMPRVWHTVKPDIDNLAKAVFDALKGILWVDDSQIAKATLSKVYAAGDEQPHVIIEVRDGQID